MALTFDQHSNLKDRFQIEVLSKIIDNSHLNMYNTTYYLCSCNKHYKDSSFYYDKEDSFVHFTSAEKLFAISSSQTIRLHDLSNMNDPKEFEYAANMFKLPNYEMEQKKRLLFSFSLCNLTSLDNLTMWRLYADDTKGVAIKFKFRNNLAEWSGFHFSKVYYGRYSFFDDYLVAKNKFELKYNCRVSLDLSRFLCFFKTPEFSDEREFRLLYYCDQNSFIPKSKEHIKYYTSGRSYIQLPLMSNKTNITEFAFAPKIEVSEIILGPNCNIDQFRIDELKNAFPDAKFRKSDLSYTPNQA